MQAKRIASNQSIGLFSFLAMSAKALLVLTFQIRLTLFLISILTGTNRYNKLAVLFVLAWACREDIAASLRNSRWSKMAQSQRREEREAPRPEHSRSTTYLEHSAREFAFYLVYSTSEQTREVFRKLETSLDGKRFLSVVVELVNSVVVVIHRLSQRRGQLITRSELQSD